MDSRTAALFAGLQLMVEQQKGQEATPGVDIGKRDEAERVFDEACRTHARALDEAQGVKPRVVAEDPELLED